MFSEFCEKVYTVRAVTRYLPTGLLVMISWISFFIPVRGRMALLVTIFLMIINLSASSRAVAPRAKALTALDTWLLTSIIYVTVALFEYALLLKNRFGPSPPEVRTHYKDKSMLLWIWNTKTQYHI